MALVEILDGPAVADHVAAKSPFLAQDSAQQGGAATAGLTVGAVVCAHNAFGLGFRDAGVESGQIGFAQVLLADLGVEAVAQTLGTAVDREVLGRRHHLQVAWMIALQAAAVGHCQARGEKRAFAVGLVPASPARVAKDVDVGGPEGEPLVQAPVAFSCVLVVLGAGLVGNGDCHRVQARGIPHGGQADGLGKNRRNSSPRHAVQPFVPPIVGRHAQARDRGGRVLHLLGLFPQRQP